MASIFLYLFLPVIGLVMLIWFRKEVFTRILIHIDGLYLPISYPIFGRGRTLLDWARARLPLQWSSHLETLAGGFVDFWKDGSLLCTLINSAVPGACSNPYRHWKKPPIHAQDVAYKYLGIIPVFTESDFSSQLSPNLEVKLFNYLHIIHKSIYTLEKEHLTYSLISSKFVARGMGLYTADQFKQSEFYIYSKFGIVSFFNIEVNILGPYSTCCRTTVLECLVKESKTKDYRNGIDSSAGGIGIEIELDKERVRIAYVTKNCGIHEINLKCNKESILGSPFYVNVIKSPDVSPKHSSDIAQPPSRIQTNKLDKLNQDVLQENGKSTNLTGYPKGNKPPQEVWKATNHGEGRKYIDNCQTLEISKYLNELSHSRENKVNIHSSLLISRDTIWANCPDYFTRENYLYFQKLVDSSFRKICRVTRTHPKFSQKMFPQFSSTSPICSHHIAPEDYRKLTADEKTKVFALQKSSAMHVDGRGKNSSFSINENKEEVKASERNDRINHKPLIVGAIAVNNSQEQKEIVNEKGVKGLNCANKKRNLQKVVKEKKMFWEAVFQDTKHVPKECSRHQDSALTLINNNRGSKDGGKTSSASALKHVDSLNLLRKRPLSKSLSDLRKIDSRRKLESYRSFDDTLGNCCKISVEDRRKLYLENVRLISGEPEDQLVILTKFQLIDNHQDRGIFRNETKNLR